MSPHTCGPWVIWDVRISPIEIGSSGAAKGFCTASMLPAFCPATMYIKVYIIRAKLSTEEILDLMSLVDQYNEHRYQAQPELVLCPHPEEADVVITNVHMRQRLERHLEWVLASEKAVVKPAWLRDCAAERTARPCGSYFALKDLRGSTERHCPLAPSEGEFLSISPRSEPVERVNYSSRYACLRYCPLECPNQRLAQQLGVIQRSRELDSNETSTLSYERAISVIKGWSVHQSHSYPWYPSLAAFPDPITSARLDEVSKLPWIGGKMLSKIKEYIVEGDISESQAIAESEQFRTLSLFTQVYGIGPPTARRLYDEHNLRTIADLDTHFADDRAESSSSPSTAPVLTIKKALSLREDLSEKIPREEVEQLHSIVAEELQRLLPGCSSTIVGGYRRGKPQSNDIDIVVTHPRIGSSRTHGLGDAIVKLLYERGIVTHVLHVSSFHAPDALRTSQWDDLEKVMTVGLLPSRDGCRQIHRRMDLIFAAPASYWTAVAGWPVSSLCSQLALTSCSHIGPAQRCSKETFVSGRKNGKRFEPFRFQLELTRSVQRFQVRQFWHVRRVFGGETASNTSRAANAKSLISSDSNILIQRCEMLMFSGSK
ncbi:unnamed protein product [Mycena citricolor]|uniref:DNA polymerase n=1 Tax=Mycena citricolor TaxID=2018698 RepID=A0AAD2HX88_9AGAR|nr:unnamed protein product [Mycena citricolor]